MALARRLVPLLLLDIDGTLCPVGPGPDLAMAHLSIGTGSVSFRADLRDVLAELANRFELVWASSWEDNANLLLASALGLSTLPVVRFTVPTREAPGGRHERRTWKLASVERFVGDRPAAWLDDELHGDAHAWAALRTVPTKLLSPDPRVGILDRDVRALLAFARRTAGGAFRPS